ncbi:long-chain-fatty-acid--CoA ligase, partial [Candidatus Termititenax aidoneus]
MANFFSVFQEVATKYPENICFAEGEQTYGEVWRLVQARAAALRSRGVKKGDVIGILSKNSPEWCITYAAVLSVGALALVLDSNLRADMYHEMLAHVNTKVLYTSAMFASEDYGVPQLSIEAADPYAAFEPEEKVEGSDLAMLLYTSGTTGNPKVVPLTHDNVIKTTQVCIKHIDAGPEDMFLTILPLYHVYGLVAGFLGGFLCGATLVFQNSLKGTDILNTLAKYPITIFSAVPQLWEIFFDQIAKKIKNESKFKHALFMFVLKHAP